MKEKKLKIFTLPIEEFEKKYPVSYSIVVPGIPEGHVAKVVSVRPCQTFIISVDMQKISKKHPCRVNAIQTDCVITPFFERKKGVLVSGCEVESTVWDTGATNTIISSAVIDALGLKPVRQTQIEGVGGCMDSSVYKINIYVDGCLEFTGIEALSGDIGDYDVIIGMDIITLGDFVITNKDDQTWFAFRYPSSEHIEF